MSVSQTGFVPGDSSARGGPRPGSDFPGIPPLSVPASLTLPPPPYARQGGEIIAAELGEVGITAKIDRVDLTGVYWGQS